MQFKCKCNYKLLIPILICIIVAIVTIVIIFTTLICQSNIKESLNKQNGFISHKLSRKLIEPRADYKDKVEKLNLTYHDEPVIEWSECE